jgi:hypothetical protein
LELGELDPACHSQIIEPQWVTAKFLKDKDLGPIIKLAYASFRLAIIGRRGCGRQGQMSQPEKENFAMGGFLLTESPF